VFRLIETPRSPALVPALALLAACATAPPLPEMTDTAGAVVAIDVRVKPPMGMGTKDPDQVYFARVDNADGLLQQTFIRSNHVRGSRAYLLNARPGEYVAVASVFAVSPVRPSTYTTYFPRDAIEQTRVTVRAGEMAYMGSHLLASSVGLDGADDAQTHYKNIIAPGQAGGVLAMAFGGAVHYRGALVERRADEGARKAFFQSAREDLAGTRWTTLIP
jgi:hypothetical protein